MPRALLLPNSRSYQRGEITSAEVIRLADRFGMAAKALLTKKAFAQKTLDIVVVDGDLEVERHFDVTRLGVVALIVCGSLHVGGRFEDDAAIGTFVLGAMTAKSAVTTGTLCVAKSLRVLEVLVGNSNDHSASIGGELTAGVFVPDVHGFEAKSMRATVTLDVHSGFTRDDYVDLRRRVQKGLSIARFLARRAAPEAIPARTDALSTNHRFFSREREVRMIWLTDTAVESSAGIRGPKGSKWGPTESRTFDTAADARRFLETTTRAWKKDGFVP